MIYILHPQKDVVLGYLDRQDYWGDEHQQGLDGVHFIQFSTFSDTPEAAMLVDRCRLLRQASTGGWQEFVAYHIEVRGDRTKQVIATGAEQDLDRLKIMEPGWRNGYTLQQYAVEALAGTDVQIGIIDYGGSKSRNFDRHMGAYSFLRRVAGLYDRELRRRVEVEGNQIVGRYIDLVERIGSDKRHEIVAGENMIGIERKVYSDRIVTALYCVGPEREDGTRLTVLVTDDDAFQRWNWKGQHIIDLYEPQTEDDEMTLDRLTTLGNTELKKRIDSVVEYTIDAAVLGDEDVQLGDTQWIKDEGFEPPLYAQSRAIFVTEPISGEVKKRTYQFGEIVELKEEDVLKTFRHLQDIYGTRIIQQPDPPPVQRRAIWVQTIPLPVDGELSEIPHVANGDLTDWTPITATQAEQIGGVELDKEYNKVSISKDAGLSITGVENEPVGTIDGTNNEYTFPSLETAALIAPNVLRFADYSEGELILRVASESTAGIGEPDDANDGASWSTPLRTISEAIRRIAPAFRGTARILVAYGQTFYEDVVVSGFIGGGTLIIERSADTTRPVVSGSVTMENNSNRIEWRDINLNSNASYAGFFIRNTKGIIANVHINGATGETTSGINANAGAGFEIMDVRHSNIVTAVRASYGGAAYVYDNTGIVSGAVFVAFGGGRISGGGTAPTGSALTSEIQGGIANGTWSVPTPPAAPTPSPITTKSAWSATSDSGTWRADENRYDIYGASVNNVTQGAYAGYGPFTGAWFFGSAPSTAVTGKSIKSIRLYVGRVSGGSGSSVGVKFKPHTSTSRPTGRVTLQTPEHTAGFRVGEEKWITLPSSFHAGFAAGTTKGIAIYSGSSSYAKMKKTARLEIVYE